MVKTDLIDERVSTEQCRRAVDALYSHESKKQKALEETELLPGKEPNIWLNVTLKKMASGLKFKPYKIPVAHPLVDPRTTAICLITKDPQREYKDLLEAHNIKFISRVIGLEKLKGKFKPFEARRMLLKENGLFLADERVVPLLPKLLGVKWFEAKKQPIPVCLTRKDLKGELERAVSSTYMNQNRGTCTSIKVATLSHTPKQILENLKLALPAIAKHIVGGWDNIQALHIKTNSSVSLPIWSCALDESEGGRWPAAAEATGDWEGLDGEPCETITDEEKGESKTQGKGKKRAKEDEAQAQTPKKKAKGTSGQAIPEVSTKSSSATAPVSQKAAKSKAKDQPLLETLSASSNKKAPKQSTASEGQVDAPTKNLSKKKVLSEDAASKIKKTAKPGHVSSSSTLTNDELKQKRTGAPGERKKVKVKTTGIKSAKEGILGKKLAQ